MAEDALWLTEKDVVRLMDLPQAIDALEAGLRLQAQGAANTMGKTHASWGNGSTLHAVGAVFDGLGYVGTKTWAHTEGGATPLLIIWNAATGALAAIIEAFALGQMRTGGISGVATRWMAASSAAHFAIIGTGKQALAQVAAVAAVRHLDEIRVYSLTAEKRAAFARKLAAEEFAPRVIDSPSVDAALDGADIVTTATRAREPFIAGPMLARGAHVNAIGAITPERSELQTSVLDRAGMVVADDPSASRRLSSEFQLFFGERDADWARVRSLAEIVAEGAGRPEGIDLSLFKAMGMGLSDLALGIPLIDAARREGLGRSVPAPARVPPRLQST